MWWSEMFTRRRCAVAVIGLALLSGGCGFHLQGRSSLPAVLATARVEASDLQSDFYVGLRSALRASGTRLDGAESGAAVIRILSDGTTERVLTVSARNIPTAYELSYTVRIAVSAGDHELLAPELQTVSREYSFDEKALLAKERERETLTTALADDLVTLVMRRLSKLPSPP
jgi:LPS-assembly lipoprotein